MLPRCRFLCKLHVHGAPACRLRPVCREGWAGAMGRQKWWVGGINMVAHNPSALATRSPLHGSGTTSQAASSQMWLLPCPRGLHQFPPVTHALTKHSTPTQPALHPALTKHGAVLLCLRLELLAGVAANGNRVRLCWDRDKERRGVRHTAQILHRFRLPAAVCPSTGSTPTASMAARRRRLPGPSAGGPSCQAGKAVELQFSA